MFSSLSLFLSPLLALLPHLCFSSLFSSFLRGSLLPSCHKFQIPLLCFALLLAHIFRYPRTQPCSRNPFRSTPAVTLAHLPYTYIANSDIATAVRIYTGTFGNYIFVCVTSRTDRAFNFIIVSDTRDKSTFILFI